MAAPISASMARRELRQRSSRSAAVLSLLAMLLALAAPTVLGAKEDQPVHRRSLQVYQERSAAVMESFRGWKAQQQRKYATEAEEARAMEAFEQNLKVVQQWVSQGSAKAPEFTMGKFADMSWEEFKQYYLSSLSNLPTPTGWVNATEAQHAQQQQEQELTGSSRRRLLFDGPRQMPGYLSWADVRKYRTPVRDQGRCGACWAFAAIQAIEYAYSIQLDRQGLIPGGYKAAQFSIQQVLDCFTANQGGCGWGSAAEFYNMLTQQSLVSDSYYPLTSSQTGNTGSCNGGIISAAVGADQDIKYAPTTVGYVRLQGAGRDAIKQQLTTSPVVCHFEVDVQFMLYNAKNTPVYTAQTCSGNNLNHALVIVGYDERTSPPSWIAKNSWGAGWGGLNGYVRIAMTDGDGTCGMYKWCFRPDTNFDGGSSVTYADDGQSDGLYDASGAGDSQQQAAAPPNPPRPPRPPRPPPRRRKSPPPNRRMAQ